MSATTNGRQPLSRKKRLLFTLIVSSCCLIAFLVLAETILRRKGFGPWVLQKPYTTLEPTGGYLVKDATLGYVGRPGEIRVTLAGPYSFKVTHLSNGLRITHPQNTYSAPRGKEIWIFGCSFTHGWSLNDEQTYPWLVQEKLPDYEVVNFGFEGYSTLQSLMQFREALEKRPRPALVILAYGSMQDSRNTLTRSWMKQRMTGSVGYTPGTIRLPYLRRSDNQRLEPLYMPLDYHGVPLLRYSAFANFLDETCNRSLESSYHSQEVSQALIEDFVETCKAREIPFVTAGIYSDPPTAEILEYLNEKGVMTVDISVDLSLRENTNLPYDGHPSALANQQYARKLELFLCDKLPALRACGG